MNKFERLKEFKKNSNKEESRLKLLSELFLIQESDKREFIESHKSSY